MEQAWLRARRVVVLRNERKTVIIAAYLDANLFMTKQKSTEHLELFIWDTPIGSFYAYAFSAQMARELIIAKLPPEDSVEKSELIELLIAEPMVKKEPYAALDWDEAYLDRLYEVGC